MNPQYLSRWPFSLVSFDRQGIIQLIETIYSHILRFASIWADLWVECSSGARILFTTTFDTVIWRFYGLWMTLETGANRTRRNNLMFTWSFRFQISIGASQFIWKLHHSWIWKNLIRTDNGVAVKCMGTRQPLNKAQKWENEFAWQLSGSCQALFINNFYCNEITLQCNQFYCRSFSRLIITFSENIGWPCLWLEISTSILCCRFPLNTNVKQRPETPFDYYHVSLPLICLVHKTLIRNRLISHSLKRISRHKLEE